MREETFAEMAHSGIDLPTLFGRTAEVVVDQSAMRSALGPLRLLCGALHDHWVAPDEASRIIRQFSAALIRHLTSENEDSYFTTMVTDRPAFNASAARVRAEQTEISDGFEKLAELAQDESRGADAGSRLICLLDRFETLERNENLLLQEFFLRDDGVAG